MQVAFFLPIYSASTDNSRATKGDINFLSAGEKTKPPIINLTDSSWKSKTRNSSLQKARKSANKRLHPSWKSERKLSRGSWEQEMNGSVIV